MMMEKIMDYAGKQISVLIKRCYYRALSYEEYQDLHQDCWVKVMEVLADFDPEKSQPTTFIYTVLWRYITQRSMYDKYPAESLDNDENFIEVVDSCDLFKQITDKISKTQFISRYAGWKKQMLQMLIIDMKSVKEIADTLNRTVQSVYIALKEIKKDYQKECLNYC